MTLHAPVNRKSVRFRARSFVAFALTPEAPLDDWLDGLDGWTGNSPGFFAGRPVVLDVGALQPSRGELRRLVEALGQRSIRVYAIEGAGPGELGDDLPPPLTGAKEATPDMRQETVAPAVAAAAQAPQGGSLILRSPVRSGQSIVHAQGDVIVLGAVGSGSEIIAGGSVHVYGALRGRVFAGATGNPDARIFCRRNEAELLAVDGWYRTAEEMAPAIRGTAVQAFLADGNIQIEALS